MNCQNKLNETIMMQYLFIFEMQLLIDPFFLWLLLVYSKEKFFNCSLNYTFFDLDT